MRTVFFCGDRSRYGLAHVEPIAGSGFFDLAAVVLATSRRWRIFRRVLSGEDPPRVGAFAQTDLAVRAAAKALAGRAPRVRIQKVAEKLGCRLWTQDDVNAQGFVEQLRTLKPDLIVSAAYPQIFSKALLGVADVAAINFHPSRLPRCRGAHPHFWAIVTGEETGGVTAHLMTGEVDRGDIVAQICFPIEHLTYSELYRKIEEETPALVKQVEDFLRTPNAVATPQDDSQATFFRNDREIHHRIFWGIHSSEQIRNLLRTEQAFCFWRGRRVVLLKPNLHETNRNLTNGVVVEPGTVVDTAGGAVSLKTMDGCMSFDEVIWRGAPVAAGRWARSIGLMVGEKLT